MAKSIRWACKLTPFIMTEVGIMSEIKLRLTLEGGSFNFSSLVSQEKAVEVMSSLVKTSAIHIEPPTQTSCNLLDDIVRFAKGNDPNDHIVFASSNKPEVNPTKVPEYKISPSYKKTFKKKRKTLIKIRMNNAFIDIMRDRKYKITFKYLARRVAEHMKRNSGLSGVEIQQLKKMCLNHGFVLYTNKGTKHPLYVTRKGNRA